MMTSSVYVSRGGGGARLVDGIVTYSSHLTEMAVSRGRRNSDTVRKVELLRLRMMMLVILLLLMMMMLNPGFRGPGPLQPVLATRRRVLVPGVLG